jgi:Uncharacterised protein family (UPF0158)
MPLPVSLRDFVDQMAAVSDEVQVYLNRKTGEFLLTTSELRAAADEAEDEDEDEAFLPEWERELLPQVREAMNSEDWLKLPDKFEIDEYGIMRDFAGTQKDEVLAADLLDTIGGRGTFGRFKNMLARRGQLDAWFRYRDEALSRIAAEWLEANGIPYKE